MTNRSNIATAWATDVAAFVVDAETDTSHPSSHGGAGKTAKGWVSETEPQQWENYNIKLRDARSQAIATNGRVPWDADVSYKLGALSYLSGILYVSLVASNKNNNPSTATTFWSLVKFTTAAAYLTTVASMGSQYTSHTLPGQNSHNDDIVIIGGSYQSSIDSQIKVVSDAAVAHISLANPHTETAIGVGTIPNTGGDFTGQVNYLQNLSLGPNCELMTNTTTFVLFKSNGGAVGVGMADYNTGGRWQRIFTDAGFPEINQLYNQSFVMPQPDLHIPLMTDFKATFSTVSPVTFTRPTTLAYTDRNLSAQTADTNTGAFEVSGMKLAAGTSMLVSAVGLLGSRDGCISYTLNNVVVVKDVQFTNPELTSYFGLSGNVKNFRVWSRRLSPRQKLRIPR